MKIRSLVWMLVGMALAFAVFTFNLPAEHVFHVLNAVSLSVGVIVCVTYFPGLVDAWHNRYEGINAGHLLTFGVFSNWIGLTIRLGRWYFTEAEPAGGFEQWTYNIGLLVSIFAGIMLAGAVALSSPKWTSNRLLAHIVLFAAVTGGLWWIDYLEGKPHFGFIPI